MTRVFNTKRFVIVDDWVIGAVRVYAADGTFRWAVEVIDDDHLPSLDDIPTLGEDDNEP